MAELVTVTHTDGVATVTLDSGPGNPLTLAALQGLRRTGVRLQDQPPEMVVLRSAGADFCTGLPPRSDALYDDFAKVAAQRDAFRAQELVQRLRQGIDVWSRLPCPVIATLQGRVEGAGMALALAADLRIAAPDTTLAVDDVQRGLLPGFGSLGRLAVLLGTARALPALLTHTRWSATEAESLGLVTRIADDGDVGMAAELLVAELLASPRHARQQALLALRAVQKDVLGASREAESQASARSWIQGDWQKGPA